MFRTWLPLAVLSLAVLAAPMIASAADAAKAEKAADAKAPAKPAAKPKAPDKPAEQTLPPGPALSDKGFCFADTLGQYLDVYLDGRAVARYMYGNDTSTPEKSHSTYKPFLHVFDAAGKAAITKGPGGFYTHHRGIFFGWQKVTFDGRAYNLWEMSGGRQVHQKFIAQKADADSATFTSAVTWSVKDGPAIIEEERTFTFTRKAAPVLAQIDFSTVIKSVAGDLILDGNVEHGGIHYRSANELDKSKTQYCLPKDALPASLAGAGTDFVRMTISKVEAKDMPWAALAYVLDGKHYVVQQINCPANANKGAEWSVYRDYGRFGTFFKKELPKGQTLGLKYRFVVMAGDKLPTRADLEKNAEEYAKAK